MKLNVNGQVHGVDVDPDMPLLWALRDELNIRGPEFGCGIYRCGACKVLINGATALLENNSSPTDEEIYNAMAIHLCRCGTYLPIRATNRQAFRRKQEV